MEVAQSQFKAAICKKVVYQDMEKASNQLWVDNLEAIYFLNNNFFHLLLIKIPENWAKEGLLNQLLKSFINKLKLLK